MGYCLDNLIIISGPTEMRSEQTSQGRKKNDPIYISICIYDICTCFSCNYLLHMPEGISTVL